MNSISAKQLKQKLESDDAPVVINVLSQEQHRQAHVPGSINIPVDRIEDEIEAHVSDKNNEIIVYCANESCQASPKAAAKLKDMGYERVLDFEGGLEGWDKEGFDLEGENS